MAHYIQQSVIKLPMDQLKAPTGFFPKNLRCETCRYLRDCHWQEAHGLPVRCEATVTLQIGTQVVTL